VNIPDDPFVKELLPEFIDTWIQDLDSQFKDLIDQKKNDELYRFGHTLKGSCFQFGLDDIAALGIELMGYSKENNWEKAAEMEQKIRDSFVEVRNIIALT
jgi:HPt (histidine-containing phosphotransfer) domain-containing protein